MQSRQVDYQQVKELIDRLGAPKFDTTLGACSPGEVCRGADCYSVEEGGDQVGAFVLRTVEHAQGGKVVWILAAVIKDCAFSLEELLEMAGQREEDAKQIAITTKRRGLMKKLKNLGYEISGYTLRKIIQ